MAGGDAKAESFRDEAEGLAGGEAPDADGDALADGDGEAEGGVLFSDGGAEEVADEVEGGLAHPEVAEEVGVGVAGVAHPVPPLPGPGLHPLAAVGGLGPTGVSVRVRVLLGVVGGLGLLDGVEGLLALVVQGEVALAGRGGGGEGHFGKRRGEEGVLEEERGVERGEVVFENVHRG